MSDWWARKLGGGQQAPAPVETQRSTPALPPRPQQYQPPPLSPMPQEHMPGQPPPGAPGEQSPESITQALQQQVTTIPRQAVGSNTETQLCPGCGGSNYFSRSTGVVRGPAPAGHCMDCGWPVVQAGSGMGALAGAAASGGGHAAPQIAGSRPAGAAPMNTLINK